MQLVARALGLLSTVSAPPQGRTLTEIATELGLPMPTTHRLLKELLDERWVRKNDRGAFYPGPNLMQLASDVASQADLVGIVQPHLIDLSAAFGETVFVATMMGGRAVCVAALPSTRALHVSVPIGRDLPLHASAAARVLLAFRPDEEVQSLLRDHEYEQFTEETPGTLHEVQRHLATVREQGFDICENELDVNVWAVSAPIGSGENVSASLTVACPRERVRTASVRRAVVSAVRRHASEIGATIPAATPQAPSTAVTA